MIGRCIQAGMPAMGAIAANKHMRQYQHHYYQVYFPKQCHIHPYTKLLPQQLVDIETLKHQLNSIKCRLDSHDQWNSAHQHRFTDQPSPVQQLWSIICGWFK